MAAPAPPIAARLLWGTVPVVCCFFFMSVKGALELRAGGDADHARGLRAMFLADCAAISAMLACEAAMLAALRAGGPAAARHAAIAAAVFFVFPTCFMAHNAIRLVPHEYCPGSSTGAECADVVFASLLLPVACSFALLSGLPARLAYGAELARSAGVTAVVFAVVWHDEAGVGAAWALRWVAKHVALSAALPVLLRAAVRAEPPELATLQLCPRPLLPVRAALLAAGEALREARVLARALLAALLAHTVAKYARQLQQHGSAQAGGGVLVALAVLFGGALLRTFFAQHNQREERRLLRSDHRRVHGLHLQLAQLGNDPDAVLTAAAEFMQDALPHGCTVALAEWSAGEPSFGAGEPGPRLRLLRHAVRSPRECAGAAMLGAVARGCSRAGCVPAALAHLDCCGGFQLASEDWERGSAQFEGWAAICAPEAAGAGLVSITLLGFGVDIVGGLWVHTPAGGEPPAPRLLHEAAECIGVALLRSRAGRTHLRTSVADATVRARADADATLALQRTFLSGITHELRTPLNAGALLALLVLLRCLAASCA
jgi:hypothetical protein